MSLEGTWPVYEDGRQVGTCTVARQGLYLRFDCRCGPADGRILRLVLRSPAGDVSLGIPAPEEGILQLRKGIPAKRMPQGDEFRLELLDSRPKPVPVPEPEPAPTPKPIPEPEPAPMPEPIPEPEPAPMPEPIPEPEPAPMPEPIPEPEPVPMPEPIPEPELAPMPEPIPVPEPAPMPEPIPEPESAPMPEPIPEPEAAPMPEPAPEPAPVGTGDAIPPEGYVYDPEGPLPGLDRLEALRAVTEEDGTVRIFQEPEAKEGG